MSIFSSIGISSTEVSTIDDQVSSQAQRNDANGVHQRLSEIVVRNLSAGASFSESQKDSVSKVLAHLSEAMTQGSSCIVLDDKETDLVSGALSSFPWLSKLLFLNGSYLQFKKYHDAEHAIELAMQALASQKAAINEAELSPRLDQLNYMDEDVKQVILSTLKSNLSVITGGPGTGKTTIVVRVLALLIEEHLSKHKELPTIEVLAPTGKAAARVKESVVSQKNQWLEDLRGFEKDIIKAIPEQSQTVQKFLAINPSTRKSRFRDGKTANVDIVVVDEGSMLDVFLVQALVGALKPTTRLILLGDPYQLASVDTGNVLSQIVEAGKRGSYEWLSPCCSELKTSHRFHKDSGVGQLAYATNDGNVERAKAYLQSNSQFDDVTWSEADLAKEQAVAGYEQYREAIKRFKGLTKAERLSPVYIKKVFDAFDAWQVFSPFRKGVLGVSGLNQYIEKELGFGVANSSQGDHWYLGKPVMIQSNDHALQLYNGDIGICLDPNGETVVFPGGDSIGNDSKGEEEPSSAYRFIPTRILPENSLVYAMTVHKSQGSEYEGCMLVVPEPNENQKSLLTREILYTAITRAKKEFRLFCGEEELSFMVRTKTERVSGLFKD